MNRNDINSRYSLSIKILVAIISPLALYWRDLLIIVNESLKSESSSYVIAIPFLLGYIIYRNHKRIVSSMTTNFDTGYIIKKPSYERIIGLLLCFTAYITMWYGSYTFYTLEIHLISLPIFISGIILLIFNINTLISLVFPITFIFFLVPLPITTLQMVGSYLSYYSSIFSYSILNIFRIPVTIVFDYGGPIINLISQEGEMIPFVVDLACSGLYSLMGFTVFSVFISYISPVKLSQKILILILGFPIIYIMNVFRITLIIFIGYVAGTSTILNIIHLFGGWFLIFTGTMFLLFLLDKVFKIKIFNNKQISNCTHEVVSSNGFYCSNCGMILKTPKIPLKQSEIIKLLTILVISISLFFVEIPVFTFSQGGATVLSQTVGIALNLGVFPEIEGYRLTFLERDTNFESISGQDASLKYAYIPNDLSQPTIYAYVEIGETFGCLHNWELCLITYPKEQGLVPEVSQLDLREFHLIDDPPLNAKYFAFVEDGEEIAQVLIYWRSTSAFQTSNEVQKKFIKISVIMFSEPEEYLAAEEKLLPIATRIAQYMEPITSWSWLALAIARNGIYLMSLTYIVISLLVGNMIYLNKKQEKNAKAILKQISNPVDIGIIELVRKEKYSICSESLIMKKYKEIFGVEISFNELHNKLLEAEKAGILYKKIMVQNNESFISWKSRA